MKGGMKAARPASAAFRLGRRRFLLPSHLSLPEVEMVFQARAGLYLLICLQEILCWKPAALIRSPLRLPAHAAREGVPLRADLQTRMSIATRTLGHDLGNTGKFWRLEWDSSQRFLRRRSAWLASPAPMA
jgi:hypothetical protein